MRQSRCWILLGTVAACHGSTGPLVPAAIAVSPPGATLVTGDTIQLQAAVLTAGGDTVAGSALVWSSSDTTRAAVTGPGQVTGIRPGTAVIEVGAAGLVADVPVAVLSRVDSMLLSPDTVTNHVGDAAAFTLSLYDSTGAQLGGRLVTWRSTDTAVVKLNLNAFGPSAAGVAYNAIAPGVAFIVATIEGKSDTARVTVIP